MRDVIQLRFIYNTIDLRAWMVILSQCFMCISLFIRALIPMLVQHKMVKEAPG